MVSPLSAIGAFVTALLVSTSAGAASPRASLCAASETPLFQCPVGGKQVAVCAARGAAPRVQYRYGAPGKVELAYPAAGQAGSLRWAQTGYSGGGEMQIQFENGGVRYVVYSRMIRTGFGGDGRNNPKDELGVAVLRGERLLSDRRCGAAPIAGGTSDWIDEQATQRLLPKGEFIYIP